MDDIAYILSEIAKGKKSFKPKSSEKKDMENFQPIAKSLIYANDEGWLSSIKVHHESRTANSWYDFVYVQNGLSYRGEQYLKNNPNLNDGFVETQKDLPVKYVFISYVREDATQVDQLAAELRKAKVNVWLDRDMIKPGQRWKRAIRSAIKEGAFFIACFSGKYAARDKTYMNEELLTAIDELRLRSSDRAWFLPVTLDGAKIPDLPIGGGETLDDLQRVDLNKDWDTGIRHLISTILDSRITGLVTDLMPSEDELSQNSKYQIEVIEVELTEHEEELQNPEPLIIGKRLRNFGFKVAQGGWDGFRLLAKYPSEMENSLYVIHSDNYELADRLATALKHLDISPRVIILTTKEVAAASHDLDENDILKNVDAAVAFRAVA